MKSFIYSIIVLFVLTNAYAQSQDRIKNYPGIPIITYTGLDSILASWGPSLEQFLEMDSAGIFALQKANLTYDEYYNRIKDTDILVMPEQTKSNLYDYIQRYTEARYTVFEAEGTPTDKGSVTLYSDSLLNLDRSNGAVSTTTTTPNGTMIYGPMYRQCRNYAAVDTGIIRYQASYRLKIDNIPQQNPSPTDTVCILEVTSTRTWTSTPFIVGNDTFYIQPFTGFEATLVHAKRVVTYSRLQPGVWDTINVDYFFPRDETTWYRPEATYTKGYNTAALDNSSYMTGKISQNCVEFKVIWTGDPTKVKLSVDKITVSDDRGRNLKYESFAESEIQAQLQVGQNLFGNHLGGWIGLDEPWSLDTWEPIRMVQEILDNHATQKQLYFQFNVGFNGRFHPWEDPARASKVDMIDEFMKRVGKANVWITGWLYDMPCDENAFLPPCDQVSDYKKYNIDVLADSIYKKIMDAGKIYPDLHYGMSIQTGKYGYSAEHTIREITGRELLYNTNVALMYGSKLISPWLYFGHNNDDSTDNYTGFRNPSGYEITDKYLTLRDTIAPRLKGIMGITLRKLIPSEQILNASPLTWYDYINLLIHYGDQSYGSDFDLGFFKDENNLDYFMLLNRYYNIGSTSVPVQFNSSCFGNYSNIQLYNLVDSTKQTIQNNGIIYPTIALGDALFFRVGPVVKVGGSLLTNETTLPNETLFEDMFIENGSTLTVNGTYNAKANITVKSGGKIVAGPNGKIIFDPYKKLILEGTTEIKGSSPINKLTLEFASSETGIDVLPGSNVSFRYCYITGAYNGLVTRTGTPSYLNITYSNFAFGSTGIVLNGNLYGEESEPSTISGCNFTTWGTGISVSNNSSVVISQNNFISCGISILNVPAAYIQSNSIYSGSNESYSGIFFNNSGGYIRNNFVKNRVNGIHLANSSPDIGGNILEDNYLHGLYIGTGSIPNLVGLVQTNPPTYYALAGYNTIFNNGNNTQANTENDGSEIYFSYSDAYLGTEKFPGCNEISDDRTSTPSMSTVLLFGGYYYNEPHFLDAIYNYWGTTTPYNDRFAIATNYSPYSDKPCSPNGGGEEEMLLATLSGEVIDTIKSAEGIPLELTVLEASYSEADNLFATGNVTQAKPLYEQIVSGNHTAEEKLSAYNKLYTIGNLTGEDENYFNSLQSTFEDIANNEADTLIKKVYSKMQ